MRLHRLARRSRGHSLAEVTVAISLAVVLIGVHTAEIQRQRQELGAAAREHHAREALLSTYERLRAGALVAPAEGEVLTHDGSRGVTITVSRAAQPLASDQPPGLLAVTLRADWTDEDGGPRWRELSALAASGDAAGGDR
jgi:hypothetical protein